MPGFLRCRRTRIEKLGNGGDQLRWRERLFEKDAVRHAAHRPLVGTAAGNVDDGKFTVYFSGLFGDLPAVHRAPETDIRYKRPVTGFPSLEQCHGFFA